MGIKVKKAIETQQPKPYSVPMGEGSGYPDTKVKRTGITVRGTGAATKGKMARGKMG